jgi:peptidyl-prolyl cis-trans isomerase B (cyclophilin B)
MLSSLSVLAAAASAALLAVAAHAQEIPGVRATLTGRTLVAANANVELKLYLEVQNDAEVPAKLLTGLDLTVKCDGDARPSIQRPGKAGSVPLAAGTRLERTFTLPATDFVPSTELGRVASVVVGIDGLAGTSFEFKVAPDTRNLDVATLDLAKTQVVLVTNMGEMRASFRPDKAPKTAQNFVKLCLQGFYDGTKFHRVVRNFMIQGGDPNTKDDSKPETWGSGGPGYTIDAEFNDLRHLRGTLSMARTSDPNSAGSGFFVVHKESPHLDKNYTAFGNLESGADTLDRIANVPVGGPQRETPLQHVILHSTIVLPVKK